MYSYSHGSKDYIIFILCFLKIPFLANSQGQPLPENEVSGQKNDHENQFPYIKICSELITGRNFLLRIGYRTKIDFQNWSQDKIVRKHFLNKKLHPQSILTKFSFWKLIFMIIFSSGNLVFRKGLTSGICKKRKFSKT